MQYWIVTLKYQNQISSVTKAKNETEKMSHPHRNSVYDVLLYVVISCYYIPGYCIVSSEKNQRS